MNTFYRQYLDSPFDRSGTHCVKWDGCAAQFGRSDVLPMWVADMDFPTVPAVSEALVKRAQHAVYGYTDDTAAEKQAEIGWLKRRYGLEESPEWILYSPGVVDSIHFCIRALTEEKDKILIQPPVYGPFYRAVEIFDRELVLNPLKKAEKGWQMDFDDLEAKFASGVKMMILCNPHNPVGQVWTRNELQRVVDLANQYKIVIVCDEIHSDFNLGKISHTRILSLENSENCIMLTSATKSFNLAGLRQSSMHVKNEAMRSAIALEIERSHADTPNIFGAIAQMTAYAQGDEWMDAVVEYIRENRDFALEYIAKHIPQIRCEAQDGTYLMWLDCREIGLSHEELYQKLIDEAKVGLNSGMEFGGEAGRGYFRFNLATQRARVQAALESIEKMVRSLNK